MFVFCALQDADVPRERASVMATGMKLAKRLPAKAWFRDGPMYFGSWERLDEYLEGEYEIS
jgi:hypothetical protein